MHHVMRTARLRPLKLASSSNYGFCHRRLYAWKTNPAYEAEAQPTVISEDGNKTLRTRQYGNKSLPLPPIMDPIAIAGKQRHKQMKQRSSKNEEGLSDFQKKLRLNPYAHALASEIRQCRFIYARLPSHFLVPFTAELPTSEESDRSPPKSALVPALKAKIQGKVYITGTREVLLSISGKKGRWQALLSEHVKARVGAQTGKPMEHVSYKDVTWDKNMAETLLGQLRETVLDALDECFRKTGDKSLAMELSEDGPVERDGLACILAREGAASDAEWRDPEDLPVYNLQSLLAPDQVDLLVKDTHRIALVQHKRTLAAMLALEKLSNYVRGIQDRHT